MLDIYIYIYDSFLHGSPLYVYIYIKNYLLHYKCIQIENIFLAALYIYIYIYIYIKRKLSKTSLWLLKSVRDLYTRVYVYCVKETYSYFLRL